MRRPAQSEHGRIDEALRAAQACAASPLAPIGKHLEELITSTRSAKTSGAMAERDAEHVALSALETLRRLPKSYGKRFWFDALMLQSMSGDWSEENLFSSMLIPTYDESWGHATVVPPGFVQTDGTTHLAHAVDLIFFPGRDEISDIDLLGYPWAAHEMAHNLMFRHEGKFLLAMEAAITARSRALRIASVADQGTAKSKARSLIDEITSFWSPTRDHRNWTHEIAADVIALYVLGPAYLAAFEDLLDAASAPNPYHIAPIHPPYVARIAALELAARHLGWEQYLTKLHDIRHGWSSGPWNEHKTNRLMALIDPELLASAVQSTIEGCRSLQLNACTAAHAVSVGVNGTKPETIESGTDLLIAAWHVYGATPQEYTRWQRETIDALVASVTQ